MSPVFLLYDMTALYAEQKPQRADICNGKGAAEHYHPNGAL